MRQALPFARVEPVVPVVAPKKPKPKYKLPPDAVVSDLPLAGFDAADCYLRDIRSQVTILES